MKKLAVLLFSIGIAFSMSACSSKVDDDALNKLEDIMIENSKIKSANYQADMTVDDGETDVKIIMAGGYLENEKSSVDMSISVDMEADGQTIDNYMQMYLVDNVMYYNVMDMIKQKMDLNTLITSDSLPSTTTEDKTTFDKEAIKAYLTEASLDGDSLKLVFDDKKINEELKKTLEENNTSSLTSNFSFTISSLEANIDTKDNLLNKATFTADMSATEGETTQDVKFTIILTMKDHNKVDTLDIPDLSDYEDASIGQSL